MDTTKETSIPDCAVNSGTVRRGKPRVRACGQDFAVVQVLSPVQSCN